jgi:hypothetical protein
MGEHSEVFVGFDTAKLKHAVAIAEGGREGEVRFLGEIENRPATIEKMIKKLARRYRKLHVCFEAGPTGYGLYRQVQALGHDCLVVAPALIPRRSGEQVKTNRRDAITLARLYRAGELTAVWVPDDVHEAVRDLVRGRPTAHARCGRAPFGRANLCDRQRYLRPLWHGMLCCLPPFSCSISSQPAPFGRRSSTLSFSASALRRCGQTNR